MKHLYTKSAIYLITFFSLTSNFIEAQWDIKYHKSSDWLFCIHFLDYDNGWAVGGRFAGGALILKSSDGGLTWVDNLIIPNTVNWFESIYFTDANKGWVVGQGGVMMMTTNAGDAWETVTIPTDGYLREIKFIDENYGWVVGHEGDLTKGIILRTIDGGINWEKIDLVDGNILSSIYFVNQNLGWGVGGGIQMTTNGGLSWVEINDSITGSSIYFADELNGWSGGSSDSGPYGYIHKTTDGGETWSTISNIDIPAIISVSFSNKDIGWAVGNGSSGPIIKTTDGGNNWFHQESGTVSSIRSVFIIDSVTAWTAGFGSIMKTTNGGVTSISEDEIEKSPTNFNLQQNYPNPFNPSTTIKFSLPSSGYTTLKIYNTLGEELAVLLDKELTTGNYKAEWNAGGLSSGVYFYQLKTEGFIETKKMILMK